MIRIFYTQVQTRLEPDRFAFHMGSVPSYIRQRILKYRRWEDQHVGLFGKLLLKRGLTELTSKDYSLDTLQYTNYSRPYLGTDVDFNISHTEGFVICALLHNGRVGIDVERIDQNIDVTEFRRQWTLGEWESITKADDKYYQFYWHWTRKEAIIKANGKGLSIPLDQVEVSKDSVVLEGQLWCLKQLDITKKHMIHLAVDREASDDEIFLEEIRF